MHALNKSLNVQDVQVSKSISLDVNVLVDSLNKSLNIEDVQKSESILQNKDKLLCSWSKLPLEHLFDIC